jgi:hypothetical protein
MERVVVAVLVTLALMAGIVGSAQSMTAYPMPGQNCPQRTMVTKMVPCTKTELVAEVVPCTRIVPVKKIGYRTQNVMIKGTPVGRPCGMDPCTKCCPQPFCQVVQQCVPYEYYEPKAVPWYNVVYKPVCRQVMMPQQYMVEATPMCK